MGPPIRAGRTATQSSSSPSSRAAGWLEAGSPPLSFHASFRRRSGGLRGTGDAGASPSSFVLTPIAGNTMTNIGNCVSRQHRDGRGQGSRAGLHVRERAGAAERNGPASDRAARAPERHRSVHARQRSARAIRRRRLCAGLSLVVGQRRQAALRARAAGDVDPLQQGHAAVRDSAEHALLQNVHEAGRGHRRKLQVPQDRDAAHRLAAGPEPPRRNREGPDGALRIVPVERRRVGRGARADAVERRRAVRRHDAALQHGRAARRG